jgi:hypothetical protein
MTTVFVGLSGMRKDRDGADQNNKNDEQFFHGASVSHCRCAVNPIKAHQQPVFFLDNTGS